MIMILVVSSFFLGDRKRGVA